MISCFPPFRRLSATSCFLAAYYQNMLAYMNVSMPFPDFHSYCNLTISRLYTSVNVYSIFLCFAHLKPTFLAKLHNYSPHIFPVILPLLVYKLVFISTFSIFFGNLPKVLVHPPSKVFPSAHFSMYFCLFLKKEIVIF